MPKTELDGSLDRQRTKRSLNQRTDPKDSAVDAIDFLHYRSQPPRAKNITSISILSYVKDAYYSASSCVAISPKSDSMISVFRDIDVGLIIEIDCITCANLIHCCA